MRISINSETENFIKSLNTDTRAKVSRTIDLLEIFGFRISMPHSKKIAENLFELRTRGYQEVRLFYTFHKNFVYILHGFIKKTQKTPTRELTKALNKLKGLT